MKVTMHEVGFEESILHQESNKKLLVDCGGNWSKKGI